MLNYRKLNIDMSIKNEKYVSLFPYEKQILSTTELSEMNYYIFYTYIYIHYVNVPEIYSFSSFCGIFVCSVCQHSFIRTHAAPSVTLWNKNSFRIRLSGNSDLFFLLLVHSLRISVPRNAKFLVFLR
jgi:hypothetical protein